MSLFGPDAGDRLDPTRKNMQRARDRMRELTLRKRLLLSVDEVVADLNRLPTRLRGLLPIRKLGP